jgi:hypothetical protein
LFRVAHRREGGAQSQNSVPQRVGVPPERYEPPRQAGATLAGKPASETRRDRFDGTIGIERGLVPLEDTPEGDAPDR